MKHNTPVVNPQLVSQITSLTAAWSTADRRICEMLHGWEQRSSRAGLERGFYCSLSQLSGADVLFTDDCDAEQAGREVYSAYLSGAVRVVIDEARA